MLENSRRAAPLRVHVSSAALLLGLFVAACEGSPSSSQVTSASPDTAPPNTAPVKTAEPKPQKEPVAAAPTAEPTPPKPAAIPAPPDVAAPPSDAIKRPSGLASKVLSPGKGKDRPKPEDRVKVHYTGWTKAGLMFDSSVANGEPITFGLSQVIKGWTEGLQLMHVGDTMRFWIPADLAYGDKPQRAGAPAGRLVFDVELLSIP